MEKPRSSAGSGIARLSCACPSRFAYRREGVEHRGPRLGRPDGITCRRCRSIGLSHDRRDSQQILMFLVCMHVCSAVQCSSRRSSDGVALNSTNVNFLGACQPRAHERYARWERGQSQGQSSLRPKLYGYESRRDVMCVHVFEFPSSSPDDAVHPFPTLKFARASK